MFAVIVRFQELSYDLGLSGASGASAFCEFICRMLNVSLFIAGYFGRYGNGATIRCIYFSVKCSVTRPLRCATCPRTMAFARCSITHRL
jgi:hypothetical protein